MGEKTNMKSLLALLIVTACTVTAVAELSYRGSDEETFLIRHRRHLERVMDKIGVEAGRLYYVYRPDGELIDHIDPDALSPVEVQCVDDDFSTADECLEHLGWRFIPKLK